MNTKMERFCIFIKKYKAKELWSFFFYLLTIDTFMYIGLPSGLVIIIGIIILVLGFCIMIVAMEDYIYGQSWEKEKTIKERIKTIAKEMGMFIPIWIMTNCVTNLLMKGLPENEVNVREMFVTDPIFSLVMAIIIGPIIEEYLFRLLPYQFIKNKTMYIIISALVFAAAHVVHDPNPFYYIWCYIPRALYYGYRYYETKDILVPIAIHSFNNLVSSLLTISFLFL